MSVLAVLESQTNIENANRNHDGVGGIDHFLHQKRLKPKPIKLYFCDPV
jgi:uncharacterized protein YlaI